MKGIAISVHAKRLSLVQTIVSKLFCCFFNKESMRLATCDFAVFAACSELTRKFLKLPWRTSSFAFCWLTRILMSKNVNIYVSRDPPIVINNVSCLFYWLLRRSNGISLAKNLTTRITPLPCIITV